jgi:hypothetical protein
MSYYQNNNPYENIFTCFIVPVCNRRSDGTSAGTYFLVENFDGNGTGIGGTDVSTQYIELKNELFFVIRCPEIFGWDLSVGIMKTDGTVANTIPVKAIHDGASRLFPAHRKEVLWISRFVKGDTDARNPERYIH